MGIRTNVKWDGDVNFTYAGHDLVATVEATAEHWYQAERKYLANGDPGYPEENEIENIEFDVTEVREAETDEAIEYTEDMVDYVESAIQEQAEWEDLGLEDNEPDEDYYEEREMARWERELDSCGL